MTLHTNRLLGNIFALRDPGSWLPADFEHRLHRVKVAEEVGDQSEDIVRDACPVRELRDDERGADLGKEHVSFAKFVPAGDYFDQCQHQIPCAHHTESKREAKLCTSPLPPAA